MEGDLAERRRRWAPRFLIALGLVAVAVVLPLVLATAIATAVARSLGRDSIYTAELRARGVSWNLTMAGREVTRSARPE